MVDTSVRVSLFYDKYCASFKPDTMCRVHVLRRCRDEEGCFFPVKSKKSFIFFVSPDLQPRRRTATSKKTQTRSTRVFVWFIFFTTFKSHVPLALSKFGETSPVATASSSTSGFGFRTKPTLSDCVFSPGNLIDVPNFKPTGRCANRPPCRVTLLVYHVDYCSGTMSLLTFRLTIL